MNLVTSIKTCLCKYATFTGRAVRSEFWWFALLYAVIGMIPKVGYYLTLAILIPYIAVAVRRLHDSNHCGWWILCPLYNIYLLIIKGDSGSNKYGEESK